MRTHLVDTRGRFIRAYIGCYLWGELYPNTGRFVRFLIAGAPSVLGQAVTIYGLTGAGVPYWFSNIVSIVVGYILNYPLQKHFAFRKNKWSSPEFIAFFVKYWILSVIDMIALPIIVESSHCWYIWVKLGAMPLYTLLSYVCTCGIFHFF